VTSHLVYRLSAALGSMGTLAGNERRGSDDWPARSAITGMLGAALGVQRSDRTALGALEKDYAVALTRLRLGPPLIDYHTVQTVPTSTVKRPSSRPYALAMGRAKGKNGISTVITHREYHQRCVFDVTVRSIVETPPWSLGELSAALERPHYVLYFGRKACPLDLPLAPRLVEADDAVGALDTYRRSYAPEPMKRSGEFLVDRRIVGDDACATGRAVIRRDGVVDRERWTFTDRESILLNQHEEAEP